MPLETLVPDLPPNIGLAIKRAVEEKEARFPDDGRVLAAIELPEAEQAKLRRKAMQQPPRRAQASQSGNAPAVAQRIALTRMLTFAGIGALVMAPIMIPVVRKPVAAVPARPAICCSRRIRR